jgi:hypothetical protein
LKLRGVKSGHPHLTIVEWTQERNDRPALFYAGRYHQFEALTDVLALEIYIATPDGDACQQDIVRVTQNGLRLLDASGQPQTLMGHPVNVVPTLDTPSITCGLEPMRLPMDIKANPDGSFIATLPPGKAGDMAADALRREMSEQHGGCGVRKPGDAP